MELKQYFSTLLLFSILYLAQVLYADNDWYEDRLKSNSGLKVVNGPDQGKSITVPNCGITSINIRIVGGHLAKLGQLPWSALIYFKDKPFCGGVILNENWILTAAHCLNPYKHEKDLTIRVGMISTTEGTSYDIEKIIKHNQYNIDNMQTNDLALLKTNKPISGQREASVQTINGVCLPEPFEEPKGKTVTISGWGRTSANDDPSQLLRLVNLDIIDSEECQKRFATPIIDFPNGYTIFKTQICTWTQNKDACQGDSGGAAIEHIDGKAYLVGVVSFGVGCATDFPGILTKISHYMNWIANNVE